MKLIDTIKRMSVFEKFLIAAMFTMGVINAINLDAFALIDFAFVVWVVEVNFHRQRCEDLEVLLEEANSLLEQTIKEVKHAESAV
jgi:hypothetical protein